MSRLLVVSHACFTAINRNVYQLLARSGHDVEIVVAETLNQGGVIRRAEPPQPEDPPLHYLALRGENPRTYRFEGLGRLLDARHPQIVLLENDPVSRMAGFLGRWARRNGARLFCVSNENMPLDLADSWRRRGWKGLATGVVKRALIRANRDVVDGVFVISRDGERVFREEGFRHVRLMPLGFDPAYFHPDDAARRDVRASLGIDGTVVGYFGRVTREKGVHILLSALAELKDLPWRLMIDSFEAEASDYHEDVTALIDRNLLRERVVTIHPTHKEIARFMNAADCVVVPSLSTPAWKEQYGRVAAEALACGKWVIASRSGTLPELLGDHGRLFEEGNVPELAAALREVLTAGSGGPPSSESIAAYARDRLSLQAQVHVMMSAFAES